VISIVKTKDIDEESFGAVKIKNLFSDRDLLTISAAMIRVEGVNRRHRNNKSDEFHFVLSGTGSYVDDQEGSQVGSGDLVHIPRGQVYENSGQMTLLVFCSPSYDENEIEYAD